MIFICLTMVLLPDSPEPGMEKVSVRLMANSPAKTTTTHPTKGSCILVLTSCGLPLALCRFGLTPAFLHDHHWIRSCPSLLVVVVMVRRRCGTKGRIYLFNRRGRGEKGERNQKMVMTCMTKAKHSTKDGAVCTDQHYRRPGMKNRL